MQFKPFFTERKELLKKILSETDLKAKFPYFFELNVKLFDKKETEVTSSDVSKLLTEIAHALPKWTIWHGYYAPPPILIIDEANLFSQLGDSSQLEQPF